jgi:ATP-dependent DNA ligase
MVAVKANGSVQLISRAGRGHTKRFGQLAQALAGLKAKTVICDGEVAVFDSQLVSRFEWVRARPKDEPATEAGYIAFDVLELDGTDLRPPATAGAPPSARECGTPRNSRSQYAPVNMPPSGLRSTFSA